MPLEFLCSPGLLLTSLVCAEQTGSVPHLSTECSLVSDSRLGDDVTGSRIRGPCHVQPRAAWEADVYTYPCLATHIPLLWSSR